METRGWKESEATTILPLLASRGNNVLANCSSSWVTHLCHSEAPFHGMAPYGPGIWNWGPLPFPRVPSIPGNLGGCPDVAILWGASSAYVWLLDSSTTYAESVLYLCRMFLDTDLYTSYINMYMYFIYIYACVCVYIHISSYVCIIYILYTQEKGKWYLGNLRAQNC